MVNHVYQWVTTSITKSCESPKKRVDPEIFQPGLLSRGIPGLPGVKDSESLWRSWSVDSESYEEWGYFWLNPIKIGISNDIYGYFGYLLANSA